MGSAARSEEVTNMEPMYYVSYYLELQKQLAAPKGSFQKPLFDGPADQERDSLRPDQTPVDATFLTWCDAGAQREVLSSSSYFGGEADLTGAPKEFFTRSLLK
jgi:hypothetical protein